MFKQHVKFMIEHGFCCFKLVKNTSNMYAHRYLCKNRHLNWKLEESDGLVVELQINPEVLGSIYTRGIYCILEQDTLNSQSTG